MIKNIERREGIKLLREYGLEEWPDIDADYRSWGNGMCVFGLMEHDWPERVIDIHMAVRPDMRQQYIGMMAVEDLIKECKSEGISEMRALITGPYTFVICNMAKKLGFKFKKMFQGRQAGRTVDIIEMRLNLKANNRKGE